MNTQSAVMIPMVVVVVVVVVAGCGVRSDAPQFVGRVALNELAWGNRDSENEFVELVNIENEPVSLDGLTLRDEADHEAALTGIIAPGDFFVLAKGVDYDFGFGQGEAATLVDERGVIVDVAPASSDVAFGMSLGRFPDKTGAFGVTSIPTRGAPNAAPDVP